MLDVARVLVRPGDGRSDVHRARGAGPLRLLTPRGAGNAAWIVTSSLGGGLVDGDNVALEVTVDAGATCVVTTQASTKVYKGRTSQRTVVTVDHDGAALVVPDAVVPYRDADYAQTTDIVLATSSTLVMGDVITCGRLAYGERWCATQIDTRLGIRVADSLVLHDRLRLGADTGLRMRRFEAIGTAVLLGPRVADLAGAQLSALATVERGARVIVAGSPLGTGALFRVAGDNIEAVIRTTRDLLRAACARLGEDPWSRKW